MPRILRRSSYAQPLLLLSLFLLLMTLPGGQESFWNILRPTVSAATTFIVNSTGDGADSNLGDGVCNDGTGACTLRAAIEQANTLAGDDAITFAITLSGSVVTLNTALPNISGNVNITGPGASLLTVQRSTAGGTPNFRIFTIDSGKTVTISDLTISNGNLISGNGGGLLNKAPSRSPDAVSTATARQTAPPSTMTARH